jgi:hypothetical protein
MKIFSIFIISTLFLQSTVENLIYANQDSLYKLIDKNTESQFVENWQKNNPRRSFKILYNDTNKKLIHGSYISKKCFDIYFFYEETKIIKIIIE